jgi:sn-glycerol 3-phosphate transport system permease protein
MNFSDSKDRSHRLNNAGWLTTLGAWVLAIAWVLPLFYALWAAFHPAQYATSFSLTAPLTLENFSAAWQAAPFPRYFFNTIVLVLMILVMQLVLCTLAAYAFARYTFFGSSVLFSLMLVQLMVMPEILIVRNYQTLSSLGFVDTLFGIGLPYFASAFAIFLLRQTFKTIPKELVEAAQMEGASTLQILRHVYIPLAKPTYLAFSLVSISHHWNNFLWPLVVSNSQESRPLTVGLQVFSSADQGIDWSIISAATLLTAAPLLFGFLIFQRQFVQSFMRAGIK